MNSGSLTFKKKTLCDYRNEGLENLSSLYSEGEPKPEPSSLRPKRHIVATPPSSTIVFQLFQFLKQDFVSLLTHSYEEIRRSIQDKCNIPSLLAYIDKQKSNINNILQTMARRFILELLVLDTKGSKFEEIQSRFEELYFLSENDLPLPGCKANFANTDMIHSLIERIAKVSTNPETDEFYLERSGTRRRGRTPHSEMDKKPNRVNAIKSSFILSCKSLPPVSYDEAENQFFIDYSRSSDPELAVSKEKNNNLQYLVDFYPVFQKVLEIHNDCLPSPNNHGFYLNRIRQGLRKLSSGQWPMRGLMKSLVNAEAIIGRSEMVIPPKSGRTYYCAYSGERLMEGEKVWHIRILVNDGKRYKKWVKDRVVPASPNTAPEFTRSIKAYFIKSRITAQCSIFYTPMDPEYRKNCQQQTSLSNQQRLTTPQTPYYLPHNRQISVNTLWYTLSQIRAVLGKHQLEQFIQFPFQPKIGKLSFQMLLEQYSPFIKSLTEKPQSEPTLRMLIFISTIPWFHEASIEDPKTSFYIDMVLDTLLDFIDLMFPFTEVSRPEPFPIPYERRIITLPLLGLPLPVQKDVLQQIKPRLGNTAVLGKLLELCDKRGRKEIDMERLEKLLVRHPCLFMSFFYTIYQQQYDASQQHPPSLSVYLKIMSRMNLFLETSFQS